MTSFVKIFQKMIDKRFGGGASTDYKPLIIKIFRKLLQYYEVNSGSGNTFRVLAYRKGLNILERLKGPVLSIDDLEGSGLGKKSLDKIEIIIGTGSLPIYEKVIKDKKIEAMIMFQGIVGVGPKIARDWTSKGIYTLVDLKKSKIKLTENQAQGLKYYKDLNMRICREDITGIAGIVRKKIDRNLKVNIAGSYRLGKLDSGDIDLIITYSGLGKRNVAVKLSYMDIILDQLEKYIIHIISHSVNKSLLIVKFPGKHVMRMDLVCIPESQFPWYVLYFGSDIAFSRKIRDCASKKGYKLNEKGLFYKGTEKRVKVKVRSEKDIFKILGLKYVNPQDRLDIVLKC